MTDFGGVRRHFRDRGNGVNVCKSAGSDRRFRESSAGEDRQKRTEIDVRQVEQGEKRMENDVWKVERGEKRMEIDVRKVERGEKRMEIDVRKVEQDQERNGSFRLIGARSLPRFGPRKR